MWVQLNVTVNSKIIDEITPPVIQVLYIVIYLSNQEYECQRALWNTINHSHVRIYCNK